MNRDWPRIPTRILLAACGAEPAGRSTRPALVAAANSSAVVLAPLGGRVEEGEGWGETRGRDGGGGSVAMAARREGRERCAAWRRGWERVAQLDLCMCATEDWASDGPV